jgi:hypothetical protein
MMGPGLWAYWSSKSKMQVPLDLDDIACVSLAFAAWGRGVPDNRSYFLENGDDLGRFRTWLIGCPWNVASAILPPSHHRNVDPVVNANVVAYLGERPETAGAIRYVIDAMLAEPSHPSDYYPGDGALFYAVSRAFHLGARSLGRARARIVGALETRIAEGSLSSPLPLAQGVATLANFEAWGAAGAAAARRLLAQQGSDGAWSSCPGYLGPAPYYGSKALTTA